MFSYIKEKIITKSIDDNNIFKDTYNKTKSICTNIYEEAKYNHEYSYDIENVKFNIDNLNKKNNDCLNIFFHGYIAIKSQQEYENLANQINFNENIDSTLIHWDSGNSTKTITNTAFNTILHNRINSELSNSSIMSKAKSIFDTFKEHVTLFGDDFTINQEKTVTISKQINLIIENEFNTNKYIYINMIGHSLGARIILNALDHISDKYKEHIKNVVVMGGAIAWNDKLYQHFSEQGPARLFNLYSTNDYVLLLKPEQEQCIGNYAIPEISNHRIANINCEKYGHTDYWPNFVHLCNTHQLLSID